VPIGAGASRDCVCPDAAVRATSARLLLLCLLLGSSWLTVEASGQVGIARVLHRRGGWAAVAVSVAWLVAFQSASLTIPDLLIETGVFVECGGERAAEPRAP
jgi:hypothetical protein